MSLSDSYGSLYVWAGRNLGGVLTPKKCYIDVDATTSRRGIDVDLTLFSGCVPAGEYL